MTNQDQTRSRAHFWLLGVVLLAPLGMGARDCEQATVGADCTEDGAKDNPACVCEYDGKHHAAGESFDAKDGCNQCSCQKDGKVACTSIGCVGDAGGSGGNGSGDTCGGLTGADCDDDAYCKFAPAAHCGAADQTGTCTQKPDACDEIYAPVCGCDDKTYGNECEAAHAGVAVASSGECQSGSTGDGCDYDGKHYDAGESFPATDGCNTCNCAQGGGIGCTRIGCSGPGGGGTCGGLQGGTCKDGEFCNFPPDAICGAADATGTCEAVPSGCTLEYTPVCGCDDTTYGNACDAHSHGTSVASQGECNGDAGTSPSGCDVDGMHYASGASFPAADGCNQCTCNEFGTAVCTEIACDPGKTCGGFAGIQCDGAQYCDFPPATMCGAGDQSGTCRDRPDVCDTVLMRVCGCDGNDYSNTCVAGMAGVSVLHSGVCN